MSKQKNTKNKSKHSKLMGKKKSKVSKKKDAHTLKMKELVAKMNAQKESES